MCKDEYGNCMHLPGYKGEKNGKRSLIGRIPLTDVAELLKESSYCEDSCVDCFTEKKYHGIRMARYSVSKNGNGKGNCECGQPRDESGLQKTVTLHKVYDRKERKNIMRCASCINNVLRKDGYYTPETSSNLFVFIEEQ